MIVMYKLKAINKLLHTPVRSFFCFKFLLYLANDFNKHIVQKYTKIKPL
jgi:hypothetical protein